jgi:thiamine biosynthesis lipoprotein
LHLQLDETTDSYNTQMINSRFTKHLSYTIPTLVFLTAASLSVLAQGQAPIGDQDVATRASEKALEGYAYEFAALGTRVELKAYHADMPVVQRAFSDAELLVRELESILSDYKPDSETSRLSERASQQPTKTSKPLWDVLVASERWYRLSDGAFDASLGELTRLWRKYRRKAAMPPQEDIERALDHGGWEQVELKRESRRVSLESPDVRFDFGGIGKGYIVDQTYDLLRERGLKRCLVNISGNMRLGDAPPGRGGWRIEIAPNSDGQSPVRRFELSRTAIATSGDLWQFVEINGTRYSHILDPNTGWGVRGPVSATAIAANATDADAMATIACILPAEQTLALAAEQDIQILIAHSFKGEIQITCSEDFPVSSDFPESSDFPSSSDSQSTQTGDKSH